MSGPATKTANSKCSATKYDNPVGEAVGKRLVLGWAGAATAQVNGYLPPAIENLFFCKYVFGLEVSRFLWGLNAPIYCSCKAGSSQKLNSLSGSLSALQSNSLCCLQAVILQK
jgi:hypothetical protein